MSRIIDADALMKDIRDSLNQMTDIGIAVDGNWLWAKLNDVIDNAQTIESEQQWIPCSERLPEEYGEYLITWETSKAPTRFIGFAEGEETGVWDDQHDRFVFSWLPEDYIIERYPDWRVIAWMPLPEPFKGGQE